MIRHEGRVAILSPRGRDAEVIGRLLSKNRLEFDVCGDSATSTDLAIVTEEALSSMDR